MEMFLNYRNYIRKKKRKKAVIILAGHFEFLAIETHKFHLQS